MDCVAVSPSPAAPGHMFSQNGIFGIFATSTPATFRAQSWLASGKYVWLDLGFCRLVGAATSSAFNEWRDRRPTYAPCTKNPCLNSRPMLKFMLLLYGDFMWSSSPRAIWKISG